MIMPNCKEKLFLLATIFEPPLLVIVPPQVTERSLILVTSTVEISGGGPISSFLQPRANVKTAPSSSIHDAKFVFFIESIFRLVN